MDSAAFPGAQWYLQVPTRLAKFIKDSTDQHAWRDKTRSVTKVGSTLLIPLRTGTVPPTQLETDINQSPSPLNIIGQVELSSKKYEIGQADPSSSGGFFLPAEWLPWVTDLRLALVDSGSDSSPPPDFRGTLARLTSIPKQSLVTKPFVQLQSLARILVSLGRTPLQPGELGVDISPQEETALLQSVPAKWEKYTNFVLFPEDAFRSDTWSSLLNITVLADLIDGQKYAASSVSATASDVFFAAVAELLGASHLARKAPIPVNDVMRRPIIDVLFGDWGNWRNSSRYELGTSEIPIPSPVHAQKQTELNETTPSLASKDTGGSIGSGCYSSAPLLPEDDSLDTTDFEQAFWAQAKQNQVIYHWAPIHTMFCPGNISEKLRVAQSPHYRCLPHQVVVDLYAGVGYFTLPYLLHAGAATVHACELNPWSVEGLRRGARASHLSYRIHGNPPVPAPSSAFLKGESPRLIIYPGDNAAHVHHYEKVAHHVNLGLLPSSEAGWPLAVRALRTEGGILHVHTNARADELAEWLDHLRSRLGQLLAHWKTASSWMVSVLHVERVKSFAPLVYHYVVDVECRPNLQENLSVPLG